MNWVEWMKGICHKWSRGRLISPSMPVGDDWYLNLDSQKRPPGRNLGEHRLVRRSVATSSGTVVLVFCLRMHSFPTTAVSTIFMGRGICIGSTTGHNHNPETRPPFPENTESRPWNELNPGSRKTYWGPSSKAGCLSRMGMTARFFQEFNECASSIQVHEC